MNARIRSWIAFGSGGLLLLALAFYFSGMLAARDVTLIVAAVIAGVPTAIRAFQALRSKAFSIDLLVTIAVTGALIIGEFIEAAVVSFLFVFGAWLEARTLEKTRRSLKSLIDMAPQEAQVLRNGETVTVPVDDIDEGDLIVVQSGGKIAVDGLIIEGNALINEATITGESVPASKAIGDQVYSGTIVENGFVTVEAQQVGDDTTFAQIIELVEEAQETKTRAQRFLDRFANIYTPTIVVLSVIVLAITRDIEFALTFLVIACPGALVISTPVSMVAGLGNGARHGVLMKGGDALERLSKIDTVVFDKTGTLTRGRPEVTEFFVTEDESITDVLSLTAHLELASEHPLGRTIVEHAVGAGLTVVDRPDDVEVVAGGGIRGLVDGRMVAAGTRRMLANLGVEIAPELEAQAELREREGNTVIFVVIDDRLVGLVSIADQIRPEAAPAIAALRARGVKRFAMFTGDNRHTADLVARQLGIDMVRAELLPQHKVEEVEKLRADGHVVAMIGDGINDAPAIATADVGLAMGAGTDVSIHTAEVILMGNRFDQLVHAYSLAKATVRNMKQNTVIAVGTVVLLLIGVLAQQIFMGTGMLIHEISVIVVILNALRLVRFRDRKAAVAPAVSVQRPESAPGPATETETGERETEPALGS